MAMGRRPADGGEQQMREFIGDHMRDLRSRKGWTQREAARRARISRQSLAMIERGLCFATWPTAFRLAHAYGVTLTDVVKLMEGEFGYVSVDEDEAAA